METVLFDQPVALHEYMDVEPRSLNHTFTIMSCFLRITYPLERSHVRLLIVPTPTTVTVEQLLRFIYSQYQYVYDIEEKTNTLESVELRCERCIITDLSFYDTRFSYARFNTDRCAICLSDRKTSKLILDCNHKYHYTCLKRWFETKNACPLCKTPIVPCDACRSTRYRSLWHLIFPNRREPSYGRYGIGSAYLEDLKIRGIQYDADNHVLTPILFQDQNILYHDEEMELAL